MTVLDEIIPVITQVGFPIVVSLYVLTRLEKAMAAMTAALVELKIVIFNLTSKP